jgi:hypothetical protein
MRRWVPQIVKLGEKAMRQFSVGEVVTWIPDMTLRSETHGDYRIVASMPDRDGHHMYRIKSPLEEYERVVKEDRLVKSGGLFVGRSSKQRAAPKINHTARTATARDRRVEASSQPTPGRRATAHERSSAPRHRSRNVLITW